MGNYAPPNLTSARTIPTGGNLRPTRISSAIAGLGITAALVLTGCSGGATPNATAASTTIITVNNTEPQNPLVPTNTNEVGGGKIIDNLFAGLVYYDAKGAPVDDLAKSIVTTDSQNYTITLKGGSTFTNGEAVTAKSFVDAWNYGALLSNAQLNSYFFESIEGFSFDADSALTGLKVVDEKTFTVKLNQPESDFPLRLGYSAFVPLPSAAYADMAAFGENPIGNGPYKFAEKGAWRHNVKIELVKNDEYTGGREPKNAGLSMVFFPSQESAYAALLGNNLDVLDAVPTSAYSTFTSDFGDKAVNQAAAVFQSFTIPERLAHFSGKEGELRRQAISMAINRDEITKIIFEGTRTPATDFTSPVIDGYSKSLAGSDVLTFNANEAKKRWAAANAISPWTGQFALAYNADGGHQSWVDATMNSLKNVLGIDAVGAPYPTFKELRTLVTNETITTAFRTGWQADYPSLANFLGPLYATGAGSNDGKYSSAAFDGLYTKGLAEPDAAKANTLFQKAQTVLLTDLPSIPLWYANATGAIGKDVQNVKFGWNSVPLYYEITKG